MEGAALLEAAELRGDDSDAELDDSDADSDIELDDSAAESDAELEGSDAESDLEEEEEDAPEAVTISGAESDPENLDDLDAEDPDAGAQEEEEDDDLASEAAAGTSGASDDESQRSEEAHEGTGPSTSKLLHSIQSSPLRSSDSAAEDQEDDQDELPGTAPQSDAEAEEEDQDGDKGGRAAAEDYTEEEEEVEHGKKRDSKPKLQPAADSLQTLKRKLAAVKGAQAQTDGNNGEAGVPIEWGRVLTAEDFERIKELRHRSVRAVISI